MKKMLSLLLVCVLLLSVLPTAAFAERTDDLADTGGEPTIYTSMDGQYLYTFLDDGTVSYYGLKNHDTGSRRLGFAIPSMIDGYPVTGVGEGAFCTVYSRSFYVPACIEKGLDRGKNFYKYGDSYPLAVVFERCSPSSHHSGNKDDFTYPLYEYHLKEDGTAVLDVIRPNCYGAQVIPETLWDGTEVSEIGAQAFQCFSHMDGDYFYTVEISKIFDTIDQGFFDGFYGFGLTVNVTGETQIADGAFDGCSCRESTGIILNVVGDKDIPTGFGTSNPGKRINVNFGGEIKHIGEGAFSRTPIKKITINGNVETVGANAFSFSGAESLTLKSGVKTIGDRAFYRCGLSEVTIPKSVTQIGNQAFGYTFDAEFETVRKIDGFTICGYRNTAAERYANDNGFTFVPLDDIAFDLWLGTTQVTGGNMEDILGDGKASFDSDTSTLTLHDPTISGVYSYTADDTAKIYSEMPTLTLTGSYHMTAPEAEFGIRAEGGALTFEGDFTFKGVDTGVVSTGVYLANSISVKSGSLTASGRYAVFTNPDDRFGIYKGAAAVDLSGSESVMASGTRFLEIPGSMSLITPEGGRILTDSSKRKNFYEADETTLAKHVLLLDYTIEAYDLWLGSTQVTSANQNDILHDGTASFDPETNTLTLNNVEITDHHTKGTYTYAIYSELQANLTVVGSGSIGTSEIMAGIVTAGGGVILDGDFTITASDYGISSIGGVDFNGGSITVNGTAAAMLAPVTISAQITRLEVTGSNYAVGSLAGGIVIDPKVVYVLPKNGIIKSNIICDADGNLAPHVILEGKPSFIIGDADTDGEVSIFDATAIQRHLAELPVSNFSKDAADADEDGDVTIFDATAIQRYLAQLPTNPNIGKIV